MSATSVCPRCGYAVATMHSKPECDANYDFAYKQRMSELDGTKRNLMIRVAGTEYPATVVTSISTRGGAGGWADGRR